MKIEDLIELRENCEKRILTRLKENHLYEKGFAHIIREELQKSFKDFGFKHKNSFEL